MHELVSVIIPVYNRSETIMNAVNSVLRQSIKNIEIIIVDDGSDSLEYQKTFNQDRIKIINNTENMGVAYSRNQGILQAKGKYITFLDSDNLWENNFLEEMLSSMDKFHTDAVFSLWTNVHKEKSVSCIDEKTKQVLESVLQCELNYESAYNVNPYKLLCAAITNEVNFTHINAFLVKREKVFLFEESMYISEDTFWIYALLSKIKTISICTKSLLMFISSSDSVYFFMDRTQIAKLTQIEKKHVSKLIKTLKNSIYSYEIMHSYFSTLNDKERYKCILPYFVSSIKRKTYTILVLEELFHIKLERDLVWKMKFSIKVRYIFGLQPIPIKNINYNMVDIY